MPVLQMSEEEQLQYADHYKFTPEELPFWDSYESVGLAGKAGSMFLWDSRAVHAVGKLLTLDANP